MAILTDLAELLCALLPRKPAPYADQMLPFPGVAAQPGLAGFWPGGIKQPARHRLEVGHQSGERKYM